MPGAKKKTKVRKRSSGKPVAKPKKAAKVVAKKKAVPSAHARAIAAVAEETGLPIARVREVLRKYQIALGRSAPERAYGFAFRSPSTSDWIAGGKKKAAKRRTKTRGKDPTDDPGPSASPR